MPSTTSTLPSARLPARRCVCKYSGEAESGSPWHRAPGTAQHSTVQRKASNLLLHREHPQLSYYLILPENFAELDEGNGMFT